MNDLKKMKGKISILLTLIFILLSRIGFIAIKAQGVTASVAEMDTPSIFSFTSTSETECSVRLVDKTVTKAIIPLKGVIAGKEYSVTSIAANGFASAANLEKVRLPKTIKTIGQGAFTNCKALKSVTLPAVETIGTNAFGMTKMDYIILPTTLKSVAPTILRNTNTKVYVRASLPDGATTPEGTWAANWNAYNTNQDVEYNSQYVPEVKYTYISNTTRMNNVSFFASTPEGYIVDDYQEFCTTDIDSPYQEVYIPAVHNGEPVIGIANSAFYYNTIEKITIGYAETPINIASYAFYGLEGSRVIINRDITLLDESWVTGEMVTSEMVFSQSMLSTIVLPNSITELGNYMFMDCYNLTDIHFRTPLSMAQAEEEALCDTLISMQEVYLPETEKFTTIGDEAFSGTWGFNQLSIPSNVVNVGINILGGWNYLEFDHKVYIDYASESVLPVYDEVANTGWNPQWDESCDVDVIEYNFIQEYNITYHLNGGTSNNPTVYTRKDSFTLTNAVRDGYVFSGWYKNPEFTGVATTNIAQGTTGDLVFYAKFENIIYTVTYEKNKPQGASGEVYGITSNSQHIYDVENTLTTNGYVLIGWKFICWKDDFGNEYTNGQTVKNLTLENNAIINLKAQWQAIGYTISYNSNKPNNASTILTGSISDTDHIYDTQAALRAISYSLDGWHFTGWNTKADGTGVSYENQSIVENLTSTENPPFILYAQWAANKYSVMYDANKPLTATNPVTGTMENSNHIFDTYSNLHQNEYGIIGWRFIGWNTKADGSGISFADKEAVSTLTIINNDPVPLYAQWQANTYYVKYNPNKPSSASGSVNGTMPNSSHVYDTESILSQNQFSLIGWRFDGWKDSDGNSYSNLQTVFKLESTHNKVVELYAQWIPNNYKIEYDKNHPTGASHYVIGTMSLSDHTYDISSNLSKNTYTLTGWHFMGWNTKKDGSGVSYANEENIKNLCSTNGVTVPLYAQWQANTYYVKYNPNKPNSASGSVNGTMPNSSHVYDTESILSQNQFSLIGWRFDCWKDSDGNAYTNLDRVSTLTATNNGVFELNAQWIPHNYTIEFLQNKPSSASNSVVGTMTPTKHEYEELFNLKILGYSLTGWHFMGWNTEADGSGDSYSNGEIVSKLTSEEDGTVTLYAQWQANTYYIEYDANVPAISSGVSGTMNRMTLTYDSYGYLANNNFRLVSWQFNAWVRYGLQFAAGEQVRNLTPINGGVITFDASWTEKSLMNCKNNSGIYEIATRNQFLSLRNYAPNGWSFKLMDNFEVSNWTAIPEFRGALDLNNKRIKYTNESIAYNANYGFIIENYGTIENGTFIPKLKGVTGTGAPGTLITIGGAVAINRGLVSGIKVESFIGQNADYMNSSGVYTDINISTFYYSVGGVVGHNYGEVYNCYNYASIGSSSVVNGGIVGINFENATINIGYNYGDIWFHMANASSTQSGGIVGTVRDGGKLNRCRNYGTLTFAKKGSNGTTDLQYIARVAGAVCVSATLTDCTAAGSVVLPNDIYVMLSTAQREAVKTNGDAVGYTFPVPGSGGGGSDGCVATGTLITLADGRQVPVESLTGKEMLLVWNMKTGTFDVAPILFVDHEDLKLNDVIRLYFSDGTVVKVISEHGFWDVTLNKYVYLRNDAAQFIGHWFNKQTTNENGVFTWNQVQLVNVSIEMEYTIAWSPVTYEHLCYYVDGILSVPGATTGLINIFEVDGETMKYDETAMLADIETYGLFTFEEFAEIYPISETIFEAFNGQYLKISIGKGLIDYETLGMLIARYSQFFE